MRFAAGVVFAWLMAVCAPLSHGQFSTQLEEIGAPEVQAYMDADLRAAVDNLRRSVMERPTTTTALFAERARVFWRWANAYALSGRPIDPDLPQVLARVLQSPPEGERLAIYGKVFDGWVREFAFRDAHPNAIGKLNARHLGPFQVHTYATLKQTYTVGDAPIEPGGGFLVSRRGARGKGMQMQWKDPAAAGFVSIASSNPDVEFETTEVEVYGMFSGSLGGSARRPYFKVKKGTLAPGDEVTISVGDKRHGGPGILMMSSSNSSIRVRVWVSLRDADQRFALEEVPFFSHGGPTDNLRGFGPSIVGVGESVNLVVRNEDEFRNRATSAFRAFDVFDNGRLMKSVDDVDHAIHKLNEIRFDTPGVHYLKVVSQDGSIESDFNPILVEDDPENRIYWGETHGHSGFAEGMGTVDNYFRFAREDARLDFMTLSEHDLWMDDSEWEVLRRHVIKGNRPGKFLTYFGYEWTQHARYGGHHNVLFRTPKERRRVERQRAPVLGDLYRQLKAENKPADVVVIPHAHNPGRWWQSDDAVERQVEVVSKHGTFAWLGNAYLAAGHHVGFVGGSDNHIGHPGLRSLSVSGPGSDNFGGMAAAIAPDLTRDEIFDALRAKRTYATNGKRIIVQLQANGRDMGQQIPPANRFTFEGRAIGTGPIDRIDLVKNGEIYRSSEFMKTGSPKDRQVEIRLNSESDPHERGVRSRTWRPWRGTVTVHGARLLSVGTPNNENVYTEHARISDDDPQTVEFYFRTRGAPKSIRLRLAEVDEESVSIDFESESRDFHFARKVKLATSDDEDRSYAAPDGRFKDSVKIRWIAPSMERDRPVRFVDAAVSPGDNYYIRVVQQDGGMAWSSPVVVGRRNQAVPAKVQSARRNR